MYGSTHDKFANRQPHEVDGRPVRFGSGASHTWQRRLAPSSARLAANGPCFQAPGLTRSRAQIQQHHTPRSALPTILSVNLKGAVHGSAHRLQQGPECTRVFSQHHAAERAASEQPPARVPASTHQSAERRCTRRRAKSQLQQRCGHQPRRVWNTKALRGRNRTRAVREGK
jgi:hypothetical protein